MSFLKLACAAALALAVLTVAYADDGSDGKSKENTIFEAQGSASIAQVFKMIRDAEILTDGSLQLNTAYYGGEIFGELALETRFWGVDESRPAKCSEYGEEYDCYSRRDGTTSTRYNSGWSVFPFEMRIRGYADTREVSVEQLRLGLIRMMFTPGGILGVTAQAISWVHKNYDNMHLGLNAIELGSLTLNTALGLDGAGTFELVVKGTGSFAFAGSTHRSSSTLNSVVEQSGWSHPRSGSGALVTAGGSVGIRVAKLVLLEFFAGFEHMSESERHERGEGDAKEVNYISLYDTQQYYGASLRYMPDDWINVIVSTKTEKNHSFVKYSNPDLTGSNSSAATGGFITIELRW